MSEKHAFISLPAFLAEPTETQFLTNLSGASRYGGITCFTDVILYLICTCATVSEMCGVLNDFIDISQGAEEIEGEYLKDLKGPCSVVQTCTAMMRR